MSGRGYARNFVKEIKTLMEIDNEITRWSRDTVEGRKFTKSCDRVEAKHTASSFFHGAPVHSDRIS
jgi:hypothetical protein